jgi:hypothetical protein
MPMWFWLNVPAAALLYLAMTCIPLWMVLTRPDRDPATDRPRGVART